MSNAIVIDVSHWQDKINYKKVTALAVIMKASDGLSSKPDPMCAQYAKGFRDAGKKIGFYHFFQPGLDGARQADNFLNQVSKASPAGFDIAPVLDIEKNKGLSAATLETETGGFVSEIQKQAKRDPLIYSAPGFWKYEMKNSTRFTNLRLWVANYGVKQPKLFGGWSRWVLWQSGKAPHPGIVGDVDFDQLPPGASIESLF